MFVSPRIMISKCFETFRKFKDAINMPGMPHVPTLLLLDAKVCRVSQANELSRQQWRMPAPAAGESKMWKKSR